MTEIIEGRAPRKPPTPKTRPQPGDMRYGKSAMANGTTLLPDVDGRSGWVRRAKELIADHTADLGGVDNISAAERAIVRRSVVLIVELERLEKKFALAGEATPNDLDLYARVAANMRRLLEAVGLSRRAKDVTTSLGDLRRLDLMKQREEGKP